MPAGAEPTESDIVGRLGSFLNQGDPERKPEPAPKVPLDTNPEAPETETDGPPAGTEGDDAAPGTGPESEEAPATIETLDQLAESFGLDVEAFTKEVKITDADGSSIALSDVLRNYKESKTNGKLYDDVAAMRTELETRERTRSEEHTGELGELKRLTGQLLEQVKQADAIDWKALEAEDPTQYVLERQKHLERMNTAEQAVRRLEYQSERESARAEEAKGQWIKDQRDKLLSGTPEWRDAKVFQGAIENVASYLTDAGFDAQDPSVGNLVLDHRIMKTLWKAAQYDALSKKGALAEKKVQNLPRVVRVGARADQGTTETRKLAELQARQHKLGDKDSTIALLKERLKGMG